MLLWATIPKSMSVETIFCDELGCDSELLPVLFDECNPSLAYNQILYVYIANDGYPLTNWTDPAEWASRISADSTDLNAIRRVKLIGTLDVEEGDQTPIPGGFAYGKQTFNFTGQIYDNNDINYTFMRSTGCNRQYRMWYETVDGKLYGGNEGIQTILKGREPITDDPDTFRVIEIVASWTSILAPLRIPSPIA